MKMGSLGSGGVVGGEGAGGVAGGSGGGRGQGGVLRNGMAGGMAKVCGRCIAKSATNHGTNVNPADQMSTAKPAPILSRRQAVRKCAGR